MTRPIRKVLCFKQSSIGDCLMAIYFLENVRAQYPNVRAGIVVASRGAMIRDLLAAYPWIEVIEANRRSPRALLHLIKRFWRSDIVCTEYTQGRVQLLTKLMARALARPGGLVGFSDRSLLSRILYDKLVPLDGKRVAPRQLEQQALELVGITLRVTRVLYTYNPQPELLERLRLTKYSYVIVHLFSGADARGLSPARKQDLINALSRELAGTTLVFTGTTREQEQLSRLTLPEDARVVSTSVQEMGELIAQSRGMVAVGTGPSHMAAALNKHLLVIAACQGLQWCGSQQWGGVPIELFSRPDECPLGHDYSTYGKCLEAVDMDKLALRARALFTTS